MDEATASVDFALEVTENGTTLNETERFDADETFSGNRTLDPPLTENATVRVAVVDAETDEELASEEIRYTVETEPEPTATLDVANQTGDGTNLTVGAASASVDFELEASENGTTLNETERFDADGTFAGNLTLDPAVTENATVRVAVVDAETDETLNETSIGYEVTPDQEPERETANVTFENQSSEGTSVVVNATNSSNGTFVAVHETTATGEVGDVIGVSAFIDGEAENVTVDLFDVSELETNRTALNESATLVAMAHRDTDGDEEIGRAHV